MFHEFIDKNASIFECGFCGTTQFLIRRWRDQVYFECDNCKGIAIIKCAEGVDWYKGKKEADEC